MNRVAPTTAVLLALAAALALLSGGCRRGVSARWTRDAFYASYDQYRIRAHPGSATADTLVMGPGWRLVRPAPRARDALDLELERGSDGSAIFVDTRPIPPALEERELRFILDDVLGELVAYVSSLATSRGLPRVDDTRRLAEGRATVGGAEAYVVVASFAGGAVDVELVLVRVPTVRLWHRSEAGRPDGRPMWVLFGLVARPETFGERQAEFEAMLGRVDVRRAAE